MTAAVKEIRASTWSGLATVLTFSIHSEWCFNRVNLTYFLLEASIHLPLMSPSDPIPVFPAEPRIAGTIQQVSVPAETA